MDTPPVSKDKPKTELDAFKELLAKLLSVPKKEVDQQKIQYEQKKKKEGPGKRATQRG